LNLAMQKGTWLTIVFKDLLQYLVTLLQIQPPISIITQQHNHQVQHRTNTRDVVLGRQTCTCTQGLLYMIHL